MKLVKCATLVICAAVLALPAAASAEWTVRGKGYGHGAGMSQYGAFGLAKKGRSHKQILNHYYTDTRIGETKTRRVRVLLKTGREALRFSQAKKACGKRLRPSRTYSFTLGGSGVVLRSQGGSRLAGCGREGRASGGETIVLKGKGTYRGALIGRSVSSSLYAINAVGVEDYVKGVIPNEVPASWPPAALRAQAVAARSYALATRIGGDGYDLYDDTRSQVYGGRSSEQQSTNRAAEATRRQVVKYGGDVAVTYFFSTSGGRTENVEYAFAGGTPSPYLKSVRDPFDHASPVHNWRVKFSNSEMARKLDAYFSGRLRRIRIVKTGVSPRIVTAKVVGSKGSTKVSGSTLRFALDLRSTWATFRKR